ncbi:hypothetical protein QCA50_000301 [Cerrena zonata]|uniref:Aminoglycoside phosphotransferase domain-containing protein n=1 Tax=Cerrena zonata TaxID=2478898 RepID=A0AAW0GZK3_9APHY
MTPSLIFKFNCPMFERTAYYLVAAILTVLDGLFGVYFSLGVSPNTQLPDSDAWSDEEIIHASKTAPYLENSDNKLVQISKDTVVKFCHRWDATASEGFAMELVRKQTRIPVAHMRRTIRHSHRSGEGSIVMDLIPNSRRLLDAWPSLSFWRRLKVILTMRLYLKQIRRIQHPSHNIPGPITSTPRRCHGLQFGFDPKGPFPTISALETHFRNVHSAATFQASLCHIASPKYGPLDSSAFSSLVFTHNDLNMRNILLDENHVLWVVDWGFAGFYPPWFEYLAMLYASQKDQNPESWQRSIKYMAEPAFGVEEWMKELGYGFYDWPRRARADPKH